jgi:hypothetical protein
MGPKEERLSLLDAVAKEFDDDQVIVENIILVAEVRPRRGGRKKLVHLTSLRSGEQLEPWTVIGNLCAIVGQVFQKT